MDKKESTHKQQLAKGNLHVGVYLAEMDVKRLNALCFSCDLSRSEALRLLIQSARIEIYPRAAEITTAPLESHMTADP